MLSQMTSHPRMSVPYDPCIVLVLRIDKWKQSEAGGVRKNSKAKDYPFASRCFLVMLLVMSEKK